MGFHLLAPTAAGDLGTLGGQLLGCDRGGLPAQQGYQPAGAAATWRSPARLLDSV